MIQETAYFAAVLFFFAAVLYTSVGHGGASGYLAVMALLGFAPALLRTTSLSLNIVAAGIALILFMKGAGKTLAWHVLGRLLLPFAGVGLPMAYLGGRISLDGHGYRILLGFVILWAAWSLIKPRPNTPLEGGQLDFQPRAWMWLAGGVIGLLSGLTGVGGGIFLSPLLVLTGVLNARHSAPVSAALILLNSLAGLLGVVYAGHASFSPLLPTWALAVGSGAVIGAYWGSRKLSAVGLRRILAGVLLIAGAKLLGFFALLT